METSPIRTEVAAVSVGIVDGVPVLDLPYEEDSRAEVDFNVIMTGDGQLVEVQGAAEKGTFSREQLNELMDLAQCGVDQVLAAQREVLGG